MEKQNQEISGLFARFAVNPKLKNIFIKHTVPSLTMVVLFTKEGLGIRSTARVLKISTTTLLRRIVSIAQNIKQPIISMNKIYEVDEIRTYIRRKDKLIWIVYALERETRKITRCAKSPDFE